MKTQHRKDGEVYPMSGGHGERIERIDRMSSILNAVRGINRGVVRGEDSATLISSAFEKLIAEGILSSAWLYLNNANSSQFHSVACGWGPAFNRLTQKMADGWLPPCCRKILTEQRITSLRLSARNCDDCPLADVWQSEIDAPEEALTTTIQMDEKILGYISVTASPASATLEERQFWLKELANDIAFALRSIENIERRQQAELALKKEALRRQVLMGASRDGICIFNQAHEVVEANQRFAEMLGYTQEEVRKLHTWDFEAVQSEEQIRKGFSNLAEVSVTFETRHRRKDGSIYDVEVSASGAMVDDEPMIFTVSRDLTTKKKLQASLVQSDRLANMGLIAAGVAHEINNPLAYILTNQETLAEDLSFFKAKLSTRQMLNPLSEPDDASDADFILLDDMETRLNEALEGARRIQQITRTLGTFSSMDRDQIAPVNISYALECAVNMAFNEIKYRARLITDFVATPRVMANEGSLSQVFLNLLINAAHAIGEGNREKNEIRVSTWCEGDNVYVTVRDTGTGITRENLAHIFEPFFTTKRIGVGSGLGLAISKNIISAFNGELTVESKIGEGSAFTVRLPASASGIPAPPPLEGKSIRQHVTGRILVVDDEEGICRSLVRLLRHHDVVTVRNGADAMQILETDKNFDVLLCDLMMPGISGIDLHKWISRMMPQLTSRVIFMSGGVFTSDVKAYLAESKTPSIAKPFDVNELHGAVGKVVLNLRNQMSA